VARIAQIPQPAPTFAALQAAHVPRERALLGARLGELRLAKGWNWYELATQAGMRSVQVEGIENGQRDPEFSTLVRLARALGLKSLDELLMAAPLE
jgi:transcriptional regulator with XRE-family HTH domain